jgi:hypothetical protein
MTGELMRAREKKPSAGKASSPWCEVVAKKTRSERRWWCRLGWRTKVEGDGVAELRAQLDPATREGAPGQGKVRVRVAHEGE